MASLGLFLATAGYAGYAPVAPGTVGSVVGLVLLAGLRYLERPFLEAGILVALIALGVWASGVAERHAGREDPGYVVIDEVAGILLTMIGVTLSWPTVIVGFLAFRVFDIFKPFPARSAERLPGGTGIMADDLVAAVYASLILRLVMWAFVTP